MMTTRFASMFFLGLVLLATSARLKIDKRANRIRAGAGKSLSRYTPHFGHPELLSLFPNLRANEEENYRGRWKELYKTVDRPKATAEAARLGEASLANKIDVEDMNAFLAQFGFSDKHKKKYNQMIEEQLMTSKSDDIDENLFVSVMKKIQEDDDELYRPVYTSLMKPFDEFCEDDVTKCVNDEQFQECTGEGYAARKDCIQGHIAEDTHGYKQNRWERSISEEDFNQIMLNTFSMSSESLYQLEEWRFVNDVGETGRITEDDFVQIMCLKFAAEEPIITRFRKFLLGNTEPRRFEHQRKMAPWTVIDSTKACEENEEGIKRKDGGYGFTLASCKSHCESSPGCKAIDFYWTSGWCNRFDTACTTPTRKVDGASSYQLVK